MATLTSSDGGSLREGMDLGETGNEETDAIGAAREVNLVAATLLENFKSDASKTRSEVKNELGIVG